jgi:hypothetical protein
MQIYAGQKKKNDENKTEIGDGQTRIMIRQKSTADADADAIDSSSKG